MSVERFAGFCGELVLDSGRPMTLEPFQRRMLADYFDGVRETLVLIPKKNAKTTTLAALALYHLLVTPDAECVIAAASRDQATILFDAARGFVQRTPQLAEQVIVKRGYRELRAADGDGRVRVLAADVDTSDGVLPTLALVDELHRHKTSDLYGVFRDGLGPRDGQLVTISTAGDDEGSPLGRLRAAAHALPGMVRDGAHRHVRTDGFCLHERALDPEDDLEDLEQVKLANPASWQTIEALRERRDSPSMRPWQWARFACGVWKFGEDSAISEREWRACALPGIEIPAGAHGVHVGVDLAWRHDTTALVPVCRADDMIVVGRPVIICPPTDGTSTRAEDIFDALERFADRWPQATFVLDPNAGGEQLAQRLDVELGARVATHSQRASTMALAAARLQETIAAGRLRHPDDEELNRHVLAAGARPVGEGWRFVKPRRGTAPIDAVIALAMAHSTIVADDEQPTYRRAQWSGGEAVKRTVDRADYRPCVACSKPIHPDLHADGAAERGRCLKCRTEMMAR